jgi:hypothetical protein
MDAVLRRMLLLRFLVGAIMAAAAVMMQFDMCTVATIAVVLHFVSFRFISFHPCFVFALLRFACMPATQARRFCGYGTGYGCGCCLASE